MTISYNATGGIAFGFNRLIELYGEAGSGKTQLALQIALNSILGADRIVKFKCVYITTLKPIHETKKNEFIHYICEKAGFSKEHEKLFKDSIVLRHLADISLFDSFIRNDLVSLIQDS